MKIGPNGVALIKHFEGLRLKAYLCPTGYWTIGWGHTASARPGMVIPPEEAERLLAADLEAKERVLGRAIKVRLKQHEYDALVAWFFNQKERKALASTLLRKLNEGAISVAGQEILRWDKGEKDDELVRIEGLTRRRRAEWYLFQYGKLPPYLRLP